MKNYTFSASPSEVLAALKHHRSVYTLFPVDGELLSLCRSDGWSSAGSSLKRLDRACLSLHKGGRRAYVGLASQWLGSGDYTASQAEQVMLAVGLAAERWLRLPSLLSTPGSTGIEALRSQWARAGWKPEPMKPSLRVEARGWGQGRVECRPVVDPVPVIVQEDMSLAYLRMAKLVSWGEGWVNERRPEEGWGPHVRERPDLGCPGYLGFYPALYRGIASPPEGWEHVGILPSKGPTQWSWPTVGPFPFRATGYEVRIALERGWAVRITRRIAPTSEKTCDILRTWAEHVIAMVEHNPWLGCGPDATLGRMYRHATRAIGLHAIGILNAAPRTVTRQASSLEGVPGHDLAVRTVTEAADGWEYEDYAATTDGTQSMAYPEIAALVYGRTRAALLSHMHGGERIGALHVPVEQIVGFGTDCIYSTAPLEFGLPLWRTKGVHCGPFPAPRSMTDIWTITKEVER